MRLALLLILLAGCSTAGSISAPRGDCFELAASPAPDEADWFVRLPAIIELGDAALPEIDARRANGPMAYRRARSWPADWDGRYEPRRDDPVGGWRDAAWRVGSAGWERDAPSDSVVVDIGPYAMAFAGITLTLARTADGVRGDAVSFTDVSSGDGFSRRAPVSGTSVDCPTRRAHADRSFPR